MKKFTFILLFITYSITAQHNFTIVNNSLQWQVIFNKDTNTNIVDYFKKNPFTSALTFTENISGISNWHQLQNKKGLPIFAYQDFKAFITIEEKEDKYRVTVTNIIFKGVEISFGGVTNKSEDHLEALALKNDFTIRPSKPTQNTLNALNTFFTDTFTVNVTPTTNW